MKDAWNVAHAELSATSLIILNGLTQEVDMESAIAGVNILFCRNCPGDTD